MKEFRIPAAILLSCVLVSCSNSILVDNEGGSEARKLDNVRMVTFHCQNASQAASETIITRTISGSDPTLASLPDDPVKTGFSFAGWWTKPNGEGISFHADTVVSSDISVYAKWSTRPVYRVSFMTYGGTPVGSRKVSENEKLDSPGNPTKQGYLFGGWFREEACATPWNFTVDTVSNDVVLHAKWDTYSWRVTFVDAEGTGKDAVVEVSSPAWSTGSLPAQPTNGTLRFAGWWTAKDGKGTQFTSSTPVSADLTLYAYWTTKQVYAITFDARGGSSVGGRSVIAGSVTPEPDATVRDGYAFGGWFSEPDGKGFPFSAQTSVSSDKTWYALWNAYEFTVTFDSDGATVPARPETITVKSPDFAVAELPASEPVKKGYVFSGWFTARNGEGVQFTTASKVTQDLRVYAAWKAYEYTVTFDPASGQDGASPVTMTVASPATALSSMPPDPERAGYAFDGWYKGREGKGEKIGLDTEISSDTVAYAAWVKACLVSFNPNGGAGSMKNMTVPTGKTVRLARNAFARPGFTFAGWALSSYGTGAYGDGDTVSPTGSSLALYATWKINSYTVSFEPNGGAGKMNPITMEYNKVTTLNPVRFAKDGYSFAGWAADANGAVILPNLGIYTMGAENARLYAVWKYCAATADRMFAWTTADGKVTITGFSGEWDGAKDASIVLPNVINGTPVTAIAPGAFSNAASLASIETDPANAFFRSKDGILFSADMTTLVAYPAGKKPARYSVPESVTAIAAGAFKNAKDLASVSLPAAVKSIGEEAFAGCAGLETITIAARTPPVLAPSALAASASPNGKAVTVSVPADAAPAYRAAPGWNELLPSLE